MVLFSSKINENDSSKKVFNRPRCWTAVGVVQSFAEHVRYHAQTVSTLNRTESQGQDKAIINNFPESN